MVEANTRLTVKPVTDFQRRARGVWLGQLVGDALGTTVEFSDKASIAQRYPGGLRDIVGGGPFRLLPGQVTDDSELALALARTLVARGWDLDARAEAYVAWLDSGPFDVGGTTRAAFGLRERPVRAAAVMARASSQSGGASSQANGALMRVSPLAIFGAHLPPEELAQRAQEDARFSHPSPVCQTANAAFVRAIAIGLHGGSPAEAHGEALRVAAANPEVLAALSDVGAQPDCGGSKQGWVLIALRNAFHVALHAADFEDALVTTVMAGGDADTNACIAGALCGAFAGEDGLPERWVAAVLACKTNRGATYQTTDAIALADLLAAGPR